MSAAIRAGYKQTEVGVIPEDWDIRSLGFICDVRDGTHESPRFFNHGIPFVTSKNITDGRLDLDSVSYISEIDAVDFDRRSKVDRHDILMSMIGTIGNAALVDCDPNFCIKNMALLKPRNVVPTFLIQLINSPLFQQYLVDNLDGGIQKFISLGTLRQLSIPIPNETEQRAIATALSDVDALLAKLDQFIAKKRDLKQAAMQQLLTGQTRLPGFGGEWEVKRVEDLGEVVTGGTPRTDVKEYWGEGFPWITPTDISIDRDMCTSERSVTRTGLNSIRHLPKNTVLVTCIASIGKNAILKMEGACNQQINAVIPNKDHCAEFLYFLFEASKQYLQANAGTTATSIISKATFSKLTFSVPVLPEQTAIATILSDMDAELTALEARRDKTRALKQGMMQELLTGRIRLV